MARLTTLVAATAFLVPLGAALFLIAGRTDLPSIWAYLALRLLFTAACVLAMSEDVARERLKPGPGAKMDRLFPIASGAACGLCCYGGRLLPLRLSFVQGRPGTPGGRAAVRSLPDHIPAGGRHPGLHAAGCAL